MSGDVTPLAVDETGNGERLGTLTFDIADAAMLAQVLLLAGNVAMMNGDETARRRLLHYRRFFLSHAPAAASLLRRKEHLCEIVAGMADAAAWSVLFQKNHEWDRTGRCIVEVGGRRWATRNDLDETQVEDVASMLQRYAPATCLRQADIPVEGAG